MAIDTMDERRDAEDEAGTPVTKTSTPPGPPGPRVGVDEQDAEPTIRALTREEARALAEKHPPLSPWRVVKVQAVVGGVVALLAALATGRGSVAWSALWGAAIVVVPGALMAYGMTRRSEGVSPGARAVSFMSWALVKIVVSVVMLLLAPRLLQPLSWPALLVALVLCMKVYWLALRWRGR